MIGLLFSPLSVHSFGGNEDISVFSASRVVRSSHFVLHYEDQMAPAGVLNTLEGLHAKILLDLGAFSPWAYQESIHVYLYRDGESYAARTGMNPWTAAHINVMKKTVYGHSSNDFQRILAHELGHLFFSQFFLAKSTAPPLWLNEGVATLMEWQYGLEGDEIGLDRQLRQRGTIPFDEFLAFNYAHAGATDGEEVGRWYNQAQSVTRYLMRKFTQAQFLKFCESLRAGQSLNDSLKSAYGLAIPNTNALEQLWKENLGGRI